MVSNGSISRIIHIPSSIKDLPSEWLWRRLDEICLAIVDCPHSTPIITSNGPLMVRTQDILTGIFRTENAAHVSEETYYERTRRAEPTFGDLLYSREGTYFGIAAEVPPNVRVCLGQRMVLIKPDPSQIHFRFLRYWLNSSLLTAHVYGQRDGTVAERLNLPTIRGLPIPVPPLSAQIAIANILGPLEEKIELNRQMNETLEAVAETFFKSWFVDFDPVRAKLEGLQSSGIDARTAALFPDAFEHSTLGKIPKGWKVGTLENIAEIVMGQSPPGETYNELGEGFPFYQGIRDFGNRFPTRRIYCTASNRFADKGDVLFSVRAPIGSLNIASERCGIGRGLSALRLKDEHGGFLYYFMKATQYRWDMFEAGGTVFGAVTKSDIQNFSIIIPPQEIIKSFCRLVSPLDEKIELNENESITLAAIRDSLLPKLLSGEIRVKKAEKYAEALL